MERRPQRRKLVKHYDDPGHCHELTFSCYRRTPLLTNDVWREMLSLSIDRAITGHNYRLVAFVYMPEHVHLLVCPDAGASKVEDLLQAIKRPFSYRIKMRLIESRSPLLNRLTIRQRPGVETFRFWQEGPGYDRNLTQQDSVLASIDYIHLNPVRRNMCSQAADFIWSSARFFVTFEADVRHPMIRSVPADFFNLHE